MSQPPVSIKVTGLRELSRALRKTQDGKAWTKALGQANADYANKGLVPKMKRKAPKQSGDLAGSVRASRSASAVAILVGSQTRVPYAGPINFGWPSRNIKAQEFIYSSIAVDDTWEEAYVKQLNDFLAEAFPKGRL